MTSIDDVDGFIESKKSCETSLIFDTKYVKVLLAYNINI